jgi:hypothetical protein
VFNIKTTNKDAVGGGGKFKLRDFLSISAQQQIFFVAGQKSVDKAGFKYGHQ